MAAAAFGVPLKFFKNPVELSPGQVERRMLFFLLNVGGEFRNQLMGIALEPGKYVLDLEVTDLITGQVAKLRLPADYRGDK